MACYRDNLTLQYTSLSSTPLLNNWYNLHSHCIQDALPHHCYHDFQAFILYKPPCSSSHALLISLTLNSKSLITETEDTSLPTPGALLSTALQQVPGYRTYQSTWWSTMNMVRLRSSRSSSRALHDAGDAMRVLGRSARYFRYLTDNEHTVTSTWCSTCAQPGERPPPPPTWTFYKHG
jgi:hypothetical protein